MPDVMSVFNPVKYSIEENEFLLTELGKPTIVAMRSAGPAVNPNAVRPILDRVHELVLLEEHTGTPWCGLDAIREKITAYVANATAWAADKRRGRPRFPSMSSFDGRNRPHWSGVGSDSGEVRTYFDNTGRRVPFAIDLVAEGSGTWAPSWVESKPVAEVDQETNAAIVTDNANRRIECRVAGCGHTESFNPDSRASYNAARGRMSRHLRHATVEPDLHREAHTLHFGSTRAA